MSKLKMVEFRPAKTKRVELGELAIKILKNKEKKAVDRQEQYEKQKRDMILRRLQHLADGKPSYKYFPLQIGDMMLDKEGMRSVWIGRSGCGGPYISVDAGRAFKNICDYLLEEGFDARIERDVKRGYISLIVEGVME